MTYNEWRDELKSNLLCVSESERRRVLDYYAEAYADRRDAGFSEREIIEDFGAPYDAAQRILNDNRDYFDEPPERKSRREIKRENRERRREESYNPPPPPPPVYEAPPVNQTPPPVKKRADYTWVFVILCIIFCVPIFGIIMGLIGITIGFCAAPIAVIASGAWTAGGAIGYMVGGELFYGIYRLGLGLVIFGVGVILCPIFFKIIKLLWKLFKGFFKWLNSLFSGKEYA